jgi:Fe-S cluster assembly ATP-binding protein
MLEIRNLHVSTDNKEILKGLSLKINKGEVHAIMGPNGSGKSSLSLSLMGHPRYQITKGSIILDGKNITSLAVDKRAKLGLFLAMQYPVAVPGVSVFNLLRSANKNLTKEKSSAIEFQNKVKNHMKNLKMDEKFLTRSINDGFSGGEKKKAEILQLSILKPKYAILDETDSGLDVDALKIVSEGINSASGKNLGILLITHYQRILKYVKPDFVHILVEGRIVKSGDATLAELVEEKGYQLVK